MKRKSFKELLEELEEDKKSPEEKKIEKLKEITVKHGSTPNEEKIAKEKIERLKEIQMAKSGTGTGTGTGTGVKRLPITSVQIATAVQAWVKAEQSQLWALIHLCRQGLQGYTGKDRPTRIKQIRGWIQGALDKEYGEGAAKDRAAHISKIISIADKATNDHIERWQKAGTGFYKAYKEVGPKPRVKPSMMPTGAPPQPASQPTPVPGTPQTEEVPTQPVGGPAVAGDVDAEAGQGAQETSTQQGAAPAPAAAKTDVDWIKAWAEKIDVDRPAWKKLIDYLTEPKHFILEPDMIVYVLVATWKKQTTYRNSVNLLLQNEEFQKAVVDFIKDNPQMFDGISVDEEKPKAKAPAKQKRSRRSR